jgi:hypothetical protein
LANFSNLLLVVAPLVGKWKAAVHTYHRNNHLCLYLPSTRSCVSIFQPSASRIARLVSER